MNEYKDIIVPIVVAIFTSGIIQFLITRFDNKKGMEIELGKLREMINDVRNEFAKEVKDVKADRAEHRAILARTHILRFADEQRDLVKRGETHSEEYFKQQLLDIDTYNKYCDSHPDFANGLTKIASKYIEKEYRRIYLNEED